MPNNSKVYARSITDIYQTFIDALRGALFVVFESNELINVAGLRQFEMRSRQLLKISTDMLTDKLFTASQATVKQQRLKVLTDANIEQSFNDDYAEIVEINAINSQILGLMTLSAGSLQTSLRKMIIRHQMLVNTGMPYRVAKEKVRDRFKNEISTLTSPDRLGRNNSVTWHVYLVAIHYFNDLAYGTYLKEATAMGFRKFEIIQPKYDRHGKIFEIDNLPELDLHPQSKAEIRLLRSSNVHSV